MIIIIRLNEFITYDNTFEIMMYVDAQDIIFLHLISLLRETKNKKDNLIM